MLREHRGRAARCLLRTKHLQESVAHKRNILSWLAGVAVAWNAAAAPGYLPVVGPSALRFEEPKPPPKVRSVLPPLAPADAQTGTNLPSADITAVAPTNPPLVPVDPSNLSSHGGTPLIVIASPTNAPALPAPELLPLSPQMFLPYFSRNVGTNGATVAVPLTFLPPAPLGPPPSSTASYEVTPANSPNPPAAAPKAAPQPAPGAKP